MRYIPEALPYFIHSAHRLWCGPDRAIMFKKPEYFFYARAAADAVELMMGNLKRRVERKARKHQILHLSCSLGQNRFDAPCPRYRVMTSGRQEQAILDNGYGLFRNILNPLTSCHLFSKLLFDVI